MSCRCLQWIGSLWDGTVPCNHGLGPLVLHYCLFDMMADQHTNFSSVPLSITLWHLFLWGWSWLPALHYVWLGALRENLDSFLPPWRGCRSAGNRDKGMPMMCLAKPHGLGGKRKVPKCAAEPDAGKAAVCQLRLLWRKKCWLLWLLRILTLWCLDGLYRRLGNGLEACSSGAPL